MSETTTLPAVPTVSTLALRPVDRALGRMVSIPTARPATDTPQADLAGDIFHSLYSGAERREQTPVERQINGNLLDWMAGTQAWSQTADICRGNLPAAMTASSLMWESACTDEALGEALKRQAEADEAERQAQQAEMQAQSLEQAEAPEQQRTEAAQVAQQARQQAQQTHEALASYMEKLQRNQMNQAAVGAMTKKAAKEAKKIEAAMAGWGLESNSPVRRNSREAQAFMARQTPKVRQIAEMAGRMRMIGTSARASRVQFGNEPIGVQLTQEIEQIFPGELAFLSPQAPKPLQVRQWTQWSEQGLLGWETGAPAAESGPFIALVDESGSMDAAFDGTTREVMAKALALGMAQVAKADGRRYVIEGFAGTSDGIESVCQLDDWGTHLNWAEVFLNGGTSFDKALNRAIQHLNRMGEAARNADILLITDGIADVNDNVILWFTQMKQQFGVRLFFLTLACRPAPGVAALADKVVTIKDASGDFDLVAGNVATWMQP